MYPSQSSQTLYISGGLPGAIQQLSTDRGGSQNPQINTLFSSDHIYNIGVLGNKNPPISNPIIEIYRPPHKRYIAKVEYTCCRSRGIK
jgi:hypothetical protein